MFKFILDFKDFLSSIGDIKLINSLIVIATIGSLIGSVIAYLCNQEKNKVKYAIYSFTVIMIVLFFIFIISPFLSKISCYGCVPVSSDVSWEESSDISSENPIDLSALRVGDTYDLGKYEQDYYSENPEVIEWIVLDVKDDKALLLSNYALDYVPYNLTESEVFWNSSNICKWMNTTFYEKAFSPAVQERIILNEDTKSKIFCLSWDEVSRYLVGRMNGYKIAKITPAAYIENERRIHPDRSDKEIKEDAAKWLPNAWWLRDPGTTENCAMGITYRGNLKTGAYSVQLTGIAARPAMWIKIK